MIAGGVASKVAREEVARHGQSRRLIDRMIETDPRGCWDMIEQENRPVSAMKYRRSYAGKCVAYIWKYVLGDVYEVQRLLGDVYEVQRLLRKLTRVSAVFDRDIDALGNAYDRGRCLDRHDRSLWKRPGRPIKDDYHHKHLDGPSVEAEEA